MENQWDTLSIGKINIMLEAMTEEERFVACTELLKDKRKGVVALAKKFLRTHERIKNERTRIERLWRFENEAYAEGYQTIIGTDEVGRGPLAGPVVAAAVVLPRGLELLEVNDSKKLSEKKREVLSEEIKKKAVAYKIVEVSAADIDRFNILHAAEMAMKQAVESLPCGDYVLIDGTNQPSLSLAKRNLIKGDSLSISIAAASIIAKVYRDHLMLELDKLYPEYHFAKNKGYGTAEHYEALQKYGPSPVHRRSFRLR